MSSCLKMTLSLTVLISMASLLGAMVPPHPKYVSTPSAYQATQVELPAADVSFPLKQSRTIPDNILVLRAQFTDSNFQGTAIYPDYLVHDTAFFDRWMVHLKDFFVDASHDQYDPNFTVYPDVFTLPRAMTYYGADTADTIDVNLDDFLLDLMALADPVINFYSYDGVIIFHSGAGQESDISRIRTGEIWSTFLTRKRLQSFYDPENDNYQGFPTTDGAILTNIVIVPESVFQDYFPGAEDDPDGSYLFSIYGVLAHNFGHLIGLPTLFDNDSSNGVSQGIGNWGLMGTGVWNSGGHHPAQLDPWCRVYLDWEPVITITESTTDIPVDHFLDQMPDRNRLYKIPISESEYFLVENRQQNPDDSIDPYFNLPSYTFKLLPDGEQDYYPAFPLVPEFNFMENRYISSEWDYFLPGLGGPSNQGIFDAIDGSGLLIWHIDENVIAANFTANFDRNTINAYAPHKGIDIEEADGIQNLDTGAADFYKYGSPFDTFRSGNNDYFGNPSHNGSLSLPTSESYYGGTPLEIYDISASANQMTFSVRFGWRLSTAYSGENQINASLIDFDQDGEQEIFYPMPNGQLYIWKDELLLPGYPLSRMPMDHTYVWDGANIYLPMQFNDLARLYRLGSSSGQYEVNLNGTVWATHPVANDDKLFLAVNNSSDDLGKLYSWDKTTKQLDLLKEFEYPISSNMVLFRNVLYIPTRQEGLLSIWKYNLQYGEFNSGIVDIPQDSLIVGIFKAPILPQSESEAELVVQCTNSVYLFQENLMLPNASAKKAKSSTRNWTIVAGFPYIHDLQTTAPLTIADWDKNGSLDIVLTSDRGAVVLDYSGTRMSPQSLNLPATDSLSFNSGALVVDLDNDGSNELIGSFGYNRLNSWEQDFRPKHGFPVSFAERSRNLPLLGKASDGMIYAWVAADNGKIFRKVLPNAQLEDLDSGWNSEYGNLLRHASRDHETLYNQYQSSKLFVKDEVYIYPNPLKSIYDNKLSLSLMTNRDTPFELKIFDINGSLIYKQKSFARAYLRNRELISIPAGKLHSGVYIAVISADTDSIRLKFAVEK